MVPAGEAYGKTVVPGRGKPDCISEGTISAKAPMICGVESA